VLHLTALTQRSNALYVASVPGRPPHELGWIRQAVLRASLPIVQAMIPDLVDYSLPAFTGPNAMAFVGIRKRYPQHARTVAASLRGLDYLMLNRLLVLVDEHVDVHDPQQVLFEVGAHVDFTRDLIPHAGPADAWDHTAAVPLQGQHLAIDATAKWPEERSRPVVAPLAMTQEVRDLVTARWSSYGFRQPGIE
jgi:4-hydroxy-3-polyprenylbenzoate decarboxylase